MQKFNTMQYMFITTQVIEGNMHGLNTLITKYAIVFKQMIFNVILIEAAQSLQCDFFVRHSNTLKQFSVFG